MTSRLAATVAVVVDGGDAVDAVEFARRLLAEGATVVFAGAGGPDTGRLVAELEGGPGRVAFFDAKAGPGLLVEFIAEQFGDRG